MRPHDDRTEDRGPDTQPYVQPSAAPTGIRALLHRRRFALLALVVAVLVIAAGAGIGTAIAYHSTGSLAGAPSSTTAGSPVASGQAQKGGSTRSAKRQHHRTRGTIAAQSGSTWTIKTTRGKTVQVTITASTKYGTKKKPAARTDFTVGKTVVVTGGRARHVTSTATRIRIPPNAAANKSGTNRATPAATPSTAPS